MTRPPMSEGLSLFLLSHLAALIVRYDAGDGIERKTALSGFLVEIEDEVFLLTAGHIVVDLDEVLARGGHIRESQIFDSWDGKHQGAQSVPFNYEDALRIGLYDKEDGIDVGVIHVPPLIRRTLETGRVRPFTSAQWTNPPAAPDRLMVIGLPSELIKDDPESLSFEPLVMILAPCEEPPEMRRRSARLYGKLVFPPDEPSPISDVDGFSGAPVLALKMEKERGKRSGDQRGKYQKQDCFNLD